MATAPSPLKRMAEPITRIMTTPSGKGVKPMRRETTSLWSEKACRGRGAKRRQIVLGGDWKFSLVTHEWRRSAEVLEGQVQQAATSQLFEPTFALMRRTPHTTQEVPHPYPRSLSAPPASTQNARARGGLPNTASASTHTRPPIPAAGKGKAAVFRQPFPSRLLLLRA